MISRNELLPDLNLIDQVAPSLTLEQLAEKWEVRKELMRRFLVHHAIPYIKVRKRKQRKPKEDLTLMLKGGVTPVQMAYRYNIDTSLVYRHLRENGISASQYKKIVQNDRAKKITELSKKKEIPFRTAGRMLYPELSDIQIDHIRKSYAKKSR